MAEPADRPSLRGLRPDSLLAQALEARAAPTPEDEVAAPEAEPVPVVVVEPAPGGGEPRSRVRSALLAAGIGSGVWVAATAIAFSIIAIPLYLLASTEPGSGLDRDLVRKGLFWVALPFGGIAGLSIGVLVGVWYARGGRLPVERASIHDR